MNVRLQVPKDAPPLGDRVYVYSPRQAGTFLAKNPQHVGNVMRKLANRGALHPDLVRDSFIFSEADNQVVPAYREGRLLSKPGISLYALWSTQVCGLLLNGSTVTDGAPSPQVRNYDDLAVVISTDSHSFSHEAFKATYADFLKFNGDRLELIDEHMSAQSLPSGLFAFA